MGEAEYRPDHIPILFEISPEMSASASVGSLKGRSSLMIHGYFGELRFHCDTCQEQGKRVLGYSLSMLGNIVFQLIQFVIL